MKEAIFEMYKRISVGKNDICKECNPNGLLEIPLSIYYVGKEFHSSDDTILFVGKTAVGGEGIGVVVDDTFTDATKFGEESLDLREEMSTRRAFYTYTNEIIKRYYGSYERGKQFVALTNIVKCNNGSTKDETTNEIKEHCCEQLKVIWNEVEILNPRRIIFYTGRWYDDWIDSYLPIGCFADKKNNIEDDEKNCWWHKQFCKEGRVILDILRTYHPDYMWRKGGNAGEEYISKVVAWLHQTKQVARSQF
jgi:hypothetical protein